MHVFGEFIFLFYTFGQLCASLQAHYVFHEGHIGVGMPNRGLVCLFWRQFWIAIGDQGWNCLVLRPAIHELEPISVLIVNFDLAHLI